MRKARKKSKKEAFASLDGQVGSPFVDFAACSAFVLASR
jgi:hypothetical protein